MAAGPWDETSGNRIAFKVLTDQEMLETRTGASPPREKQKEDDTRAKNYRDWLLAQVHVNTLAKAGDDSAVG